MGRVDAGPAADVRDSGGGGEVPLEDVPGAQSGQGAEAGLVQPRALVIHLVEVMHSSVDVHDGECRKLTLAESRRYRWRSWAVSGSPQACGVRGCSHGVLR